MTTAIAPAKTDGKTMLAPVGDTNTLKAILEQASDAIAAIVPQHLTAKRMLKMALVAANRTPKLLTCTRESVLQSVMRASELGLDCSGTLGSAYLVPFRNNKRGVMECVFWPGYRGLIDLARRGGQIATIEAHVVYQNDEFELQYGTSPKLNHSPCIDSDPGKVRCVYAIARLRDGSVQTEVMTKAQVDSIRARSKAATSGPWATDYGEMARKTVVKRIAKYLPLSAELETALAIENDIEDSPDYAAQVVADVAEGASRTEALAERLAPAEEAAPDEPPIPPKRGRPRGSKNKTKPASPPAPEPEPPEPEGLAPGQDQHGRLCKLIGDAYRGLSPIQQQAALSQAGLDNIAQVETALLTTDDLRNTLQVMLEHGADPHPELKRGE